MYCTDTFTLKRYRKDYKTSVAAQRRSLYIPQPWQLPLFNTTSQMRKDQDCNSQSLNLDRDPHPQEWKKKPLKQRHHKLPKNNKVMNVNDLYRPRPRTTSAARTFSS